VSSEISQKTALGKVENEETTIHEPPSTGSEWYENSLLITIIVAAILLALVLIMSAVHIKVQLEHEVGQRQLRPEERWWWEFKHLMLLEIGIAIFVAGFITATLELFLRHRADVEHARRTRDVEAKHQKYLHEVQENLFNALFGFHVDRKLGGELFQTLKQLPM